MITAGVETGRGHPMVRLNMLGWRCEWQKARQGRLRGHNDSVHGYCNLIANQLLGRQSMFHFKGTGHLIMIMAGVETGC